MVNNVVLVGRITRDPELRTVASGTPTVSFTLAIDRIPSRDGQTQADFVPCVAWNQTAQFIGNYVKKGYMLSVEGRIQTRNYQDQNGTTRYVTEVYCNRVQNLTPRNSSQTGDNSNYQNYQANNQGNDLDPNKGFTADVSDDDLPF